ncbi:unnamed protein product [Polarella glacialis]|uniref:Uncharacterized protein n=1 Tax=Polarella glacialis TaxID=89957 RepID=A0A813IJG0_POLGL|nr:unnamed protein product [Polarella glacialis]CAE8651321.1 unnamed protein product [Polarella glacialis]
MRDEDVWWLTLDDGTYLLAVHCEDEKATIFSYAARLCQGCLGLSSAHGQVTSVKDDALRDKIAAALQAAGLQPSFHIVAAAGTRALGLGSNKAKCRRAGYLALATAAALRSSRLEVRPGGELHKVAVAALSAATRCIIVSSTPVGRKVQMCKEDLARLRRSIPDSPAAVSEGLQRRTTCSRGSDPLAVTLNSAVETTKMLQRSLESAKEEHRQHTARAAAAAAGGAALLRSTGFSRDAHPARNNNNNNNRVRCRSQSPGSDRSPSPRARRIRCPSNNNDINNKSMSSLPSRGCPVAMTRIVRTARRRLQMGSGGIDVKDEGFVSDSNNNNNSDCSRGRPVAPLVARQVHILRRASQKGRPWDPAARHGGECALAHYQHLLRFVPVLQLHFAHDEISPTYRNGPHAGQSVQKLEEDFVAGRARPESITPLVGVLDRCKIWIISGNRRLYSLRKYAERTRMMQGAAAAAAVRAPVLVHLHESGQLPQGLFAKYIEAMSTDCGKLPRIRTSGNNNNDYNNTNNSSNNNNGKRIRSEECLEPRASKRQRTQSGGCAQEKAVAPNNNNNTCNSTNTNNNNNNPEASAPSSGGCQAAMHNNNNNVMQRLEGRWRGERGELYEVKNNNSNNNRMPCSGWHCIRNKGSGVSSFRLTFDSVRGVVTWGEKGSYHARCEGTSLRGTPQVVWLNSQGQIVFSWTKDQP